MTRTEKKQILEAAEFVANNPTAHSCHAINWVVERDSSSWCQLTHDYAAFYERTAISYWPGLPPPPIVGSAFEEFEIEEKKNLRLLLLLWFREVGFEGIQ